MTPPAIATMTAAQIEERVAETARAVDQIRDRTASDLADRFASQRATLDLSRATVGDVVDVAATVIAAMMSVTGIELYATQIHAGWLIASGRIAEMQTGEGKTYACLLPACLMAFGGMGVHVACPNDYLASRDHDLLAPVYRSLGLTTASLTGNESVGNEASVAYRSDVLYAAAHTFGFDYLRDQLSLHHWQQIVDDRSLAGQCPGKGKSSRSGFSEH